MDTPQGFIERIRAKQRQEDNEREHREAIRRNAAIAKIRQQKAVSAARVFGKPKQQSGVGPIGSGSTVLTPTTKPNNDPFGLDDLRHRLAEAEKESQKLRLAVDAALAIHTKVEDKREGRDFYCGYCSTVYPCVTAQALLGEDG